jgi:glycerol transport system ATP-binding protein
MDLSLRAVSKKVGAQPWLYALDMDLRPDAVTVLLGATQAGKTSLMRIMAGLDVPSTGRVVVDGVDVVGVPVRQRNVSMVYQQFINYPSMTVFDNIASPLHLRGETGVRERVHALADKLHIEMFLERYPSELSGGQQQRVHHGSGMPSWGEAAAFLPAWTRSAASTSLGGSSHALVHES